VIARPGRARLTAGVQAESNPAPPGARRLRLWPAGLIVGVLAVVLIVIRRLEHLPYQSRNLASLAAALAALALLWVWWLLGSRALWRWRLAVCGGVLVLAGLGAALFRIRGVSGDLVPILEPRWVRHGTPAGGSIPEPPAAAAARAVPAAPAPRPDFPQFLGPERNGVIAGVKLDPDWAAHPPQVLWRRPVGAAWSGFAVVGARALTQEQDGDLELVTCYDLASGRRLWQHADRARYFTTLAGEGPRCTPTVVSNRVFALGATGILNCLDLADGRRVWSRSLTADASSSVPEWGFAGSPLVYEDKVIVSAGGRDHHSALAYHVHTGELVWHAGTRAASYSSPALLTLAGRPQVLLFNSRYITAHDPHTGQVLWEYPWGMGHPNVAQPVPVDANRVVFSSGYGVGAELLEVTAEAPDQLAARRVWKSPRLKSKFANFVRRGEHLYGLDDGVLVCVAVRDGAQLWKEGRYGHGQMLLVDDRLLVMAENGELVLLEPTPEAPNERHRFRVFSSKTWNPPALAGDLLLVRNDREAACLRLAAEDRGTARQLDTTEEKPR
jgi:outer membrane protein assembly factor BamB